MPEGSSIDRTCVIHLITVQAAAGTAAVAKVVGSATKTMGAMNKAMNPGQVNKAMQGFAKVSNA
jgi:methenyltetrahydromethanopterin cyclohydrolase